MKQRLTLRLTMILMLAAALAGCSGTPSMETDDSVQESVEQEQVIKVGNLTVTVPMEWSVKDHEPSDSESQGIYIYPDYGGLLDIIATEDKILSLASAERYCDEMVEGMEKSGQLEFGEPREQFTLGSGIAFRMPCRGHFVEEYMGEVELIFCEDAYYSVAFLVPEEIAEERSQDIDEVLDSITIGGDDGSSDAEVANRVRETNTSSGDALPHDMDQKTYDLALEAITVGEDYLAGNLSQVEAHAKLAAIYDILDSYPAENSAWNTIVRGKVLNMRFCIDPIAPMEREDKGFEDFLAELEEIVEYQP